MRSKCPEHGYNLSLALQDVTHARQLVSVPELWQATLPR